MRKGFKKLFALVMVVAMATTGTAPVWAGEEADEIREVRVVKDSLQQTWRGVYKKQTENGYVTGSVTIVKDPTHEVVAKGFWTEVTELGRSPWCKTGVKSVSELAKDPNVRNYIGSKTSLNALQQSVLIAALDQPEKWLTVKAGQLPILAAFWGENWQRYKVRMNLDERFKNTDVFLFFSPELNEWYAFYSACCNLAQPYATYSWVETQTIVVAKVPKCERLVPDGTGPIPHNGTRKFQVEMDNPSGVPIEARIEVLDRTNKVVQSAVNQDSILVSNLGPGRYRVFVKATYGKEKIAVNTAACSAEFAVEEPPLPSISMQPPPAPDDTPKKAGSKKKWVWVGVAAGAGAAAIILATQGGSKGVKIPGRPANIP